MFILYRRKCFLYIFNVCITCHVIMHFIRCIATIALIYIFRLTHCRCICSICRNSSKRSNYKRIFVRTQWPLMVIIKCMINIVWLHLFNDAMYFVFVIPYNAWSPYTNHTWFSTICVYSWLNGMQCNVSSQ